MAQRWSFEEDHIVGSFSYEHIFEVINDALLNELMLKLAANGYASRTRTAVQKRACEYQRSFYVIGEIPHIPVQVQKLAQVIANKDKNYEWSLRLNSVINEASEEYENDNDNLDCLIEKTSDLIFLEPLSSLGPTLREVFFGFVEKKGMTIPDICQNSQVDKATISRIKKHPEKSISKTTAMCLCFGLELTLGEAQQLMESAGHKLASNPVDLLVAAYFNAKNHDIFDANEQLYDRELPLLFGHTKKERNVSGN